MTVSALLPAVLRELLQAFVLQKQSLANSRWLQLPAVNEVINRSRANAKETCRRLPV